KLCTSVENDHYFLFNSDGKKEVNFEFLKACGISRYNSYNNLPDLYPKDSAIPVKFRSIFTPIRVFLHLLQLNSPDFATRITSALILSGRCNSAVKVYSKPDLNFFSPGKLEENSVI